MPTAPTEGKEMTERIRFLSPKEARQLTSLSERTLGRLAKAGQFPQPVPLCEGSSRIGFVESEVLAWNAARLAKARGRTAAAPHPPSPPPPKDGPGDRGPAKRGRRRGSYARAGPRPTPTTTADAHPAE